jgi:oligopeptide transport system substrate-binding protein
MRKKMLQQAEKLLINEMPIAPIYHFNYAIITQPYVKNMCVGPLGDLHYDKVSLEKK